MKTVIRTERGWAGHFIAADSCRFRRNTLLACEDQKIVISTVGFMMVNGKIDTIGHNRYYETMAFHAGKNKWDDIDVSKPVYFESEWAISEQYAEIEANDMHEAVVNEISEKLQKGHKFPIAEEIE